MPRSDQRAVTAFPLRLIGASGGRVPNYGGAGAAVTATDDECGPAEESTSAQVAHLKKQLEVAECAARSPKRPRQTSTARP